MREVQDLADWGGMIDDGPAKHGRKFTCDYLKQNCPPNGTKYKLPFILVSEHSGKQGQVETKSVKQMLKVISEII